MSMRSVCLVMHELKSYLPQRPKTCYYIIIQKPFLSCARFYRSADIAPVRCVTPSEHLFKLGFRERMLMKSDCFDQFHLLGNILLTFWALCCRHHICYFINEDERIFVNNFLFGSLLNHFGVWFLLFRGIKASNIWDKLEITKGRFRHTADERREKKQINNPCRLSHTTKKLLGY